MARPVTLFTGQWADLPPRLSNENQSLAAPRTLFMPLSVRSLAAGTGGALVFTPCTTPLRPPSR